MGAGLMLAGVAAVAVGAGSPVAEAAVRATRTPVLPGTVARWQHQRFRGSAFVVELPAGTLPATRVRRHVRAVLAVALPDARDVGRWSPAGLGV